jgi:hypothetical protein
MDELLKLAEAYYATAQDLERQGTHYLQVAQMLSGIADRICEENMRRKQPTDNSAGEQHGSGS